MSLALLMGLDELALSILGATRRNLDTCVKKDMFERSMSIEISIIECYYPIEFK